MKALFQDLFHQNVAVPKTKLVKHFFFNLVAGLFYSLRIAPVLSPLPSRDRQVLVMKHNRVHQ